MRRNETHYLFTSIKAIENIITEPYEFRLSALDVFQSID